MYKEIIKNCGLIISEYKPDEERESQNFLKRNRIISGLALGVIVIEATYRSGTSVTAKLAKEQNKKVFAIPHEIWNSKGVGTNKLIKNGAILVNDTKDILKELKIALDNTIQEFNIKDKFIIRPNIVSNKSNSKDLNSKVENNINQEMNLENDKLEEVYSLILKNKNDLVSINYLCENTKKSVREVTNILFALEIEGKIKKSIGGYKCT